MRASKALLLAAATVAAVGCGSGEPAPVQGDAEITKTSPTTSESDPAFAARSQEKEARAKGRLNR